MNKNTERNEGYTQAASDVDGLNAPSVNDLDVETGAIAADETDEIAETRVQIEDTRAHMSETIDAIKDKLSPATLIAEAKDAVKEAASDKAHQITDSVVDMAKGAAATVSDAVKSAADFVTGKAGPAMDTAKDKMAPVVDTAKHIGSTAKDAGGSVVDTIRMNPLPAAMIGIGVGWLLMSARRQHSDHNNYSDGRRDVYDNYRGSESRDTYRPDTYRTEDYRASDWENRQPTGGVADALTGQDERVHGSRGAMSGIASSASNLAHSAGDLAHDAKEKVSDLASATKDKVSDLASATKDKVGDLASATKYRATATYSTLDGWVHENPLAAGAVALLIGAAVGLAIPSTRKENEWFGQTRDELAHKATEKAHEVVDKVQHVAESAISTAKHIAGDAARDVKHTVSDAATQIKTEVKEEIRTQGMATV